MSFPSYSASPTAPPRDRVVGTVGTGLLAVLRYGLVRRIDAEAQAREERSPARSQISWSDFDRISKRTLERQGRANLRSI